MKLQAPALLTLAVPIAPPLQERFTVELATAVPVTVTVSLEFSTSFPMTGTAGSGTVTLSGLEAGLAAVAVGSVAVNVYAPAFRPDVVKVQAPVLLAFVVPSALEPPFQTVTVTPAVAVPVRVTEPLALATPVLRTGAGSIVRLNALDAALVPTEVVSVAVNA